VNTYTVQTTETVVREYLVTAPDEERAPDLATTGDYGVLGDRSKRLVRA
jgi:hypothetical protein